MQVRLSSGKYDIIASGETFLFDATDEFEICLHENEAIYAQFVLQFKFDDTTDQYIDMDVKDKKLYIYCYNFNDRGTGLSSPKEIATINGKSVYFLIWSDIRGNGEKKIRRVEYTLFMDRS